MIQDVMVDLETLGTGTNAVILSLGAVPFSYTDPFDVKILRDPKLNGKMYFSANFNAEVQVSKGRKIDASTVFWWMKQGEEAKKKLEPSFRDLGSLKDAEAITVASLEKFSAFAHQFGGEECRLWGNGNMFDLVLLRSLYASFGVPYPVHFRCDLDFRTIKRLGESLGISPEAPNSAKDLTHHAAVDDAAYQALQFQEIYQRFHRSEAKDALYDF